MRIIGGHDYYDGGLAYGIDDAVTFLRNGDRRATTAEMHEVYHLPYETCGAKFDGQESRFGWDRPDRHRLTSTKVRRDGRDVEHIVEHADVILCGRLHHGVHITARKGFGVSDRIEERWIWTADGLRSYARDHELELDDGREKSGRRWVGRTMRNQVDTLSRTLDQWFEPITLGSAARDALVENRVTIAARNPLDRYPARNAANEPLDWAIDQPGLRDMGFAKAVDPYTAFQEISMWKGGVLPSDGPPIVEITDDRIKIAKAGFDHPGSFRRAKAGS